jgi:hypothetical protein
MKMHKKTKTNLPLAALAMAGFALTATPITAAPIAVSSSVYNPQPLGNGGTVLTDSSNLKLTDGTLGDTAGYTGGTYVGWKSQSPDEITFDLGAVVDVGTVDVFAEGGFSGALPDSVTVSVSSNNVDYSTAVPVTMTFAVDSGKRSLATLDVSTLADARYYRLTFVSSDQWMMIGEIAFADLSADTTPPTLASSDIVDDKSGGPVSGNTPMVYTVTFSEDMDAGTFSSADFEDMGGDVSITIGAITEITPGVFTVAVTPTSAGTLELQVPIGATLNDAAGVPLDTTIAAIVDDTSITITAPDVTDPTLASSDIVDNQSGGPVTALSIVNYTVTFSEDMDAATVTTNDFENAGTSGVNILFVDETAPGVFSVQVQPTDAGTLRLAVKSGANLNDVAPAPNALDTSSAIEDDTTITVDALVNDPVISAGASYAYDTSGGCRAGSQWFSRGPRRRRN